MSRSVFPLGSVPPPPTSASLRASQRASRLARPESPFALWSSILMLVGWALLAAAGWAYSEARPVAYKIDKWFGVVRPRGWDQQTLLLAAMLAAVALGLTAAALIVHSLQPKPATKSPAAAWSLLVLTVLSVIYGLVEVATM